MSKINVSKEDISSWYNEVQNARMNTMASVGWTRILKDHVKVTEGASPRLETEIRTALGDLNNALATLDGVFDSIESLDNERQVV